MDYRCDNARELNHAFNSGQMRPVSTTHEGRVVTYAFDRLNTPCSYARTTRDRFIRVDSHADKPALHILSADKTRFEYVNVGLPLDEYIDVTRNFSQKDLLPPQTMSQWLWHDFTSRIGWIALGVFAGHGVSQAAHYASHHVAQTMVATGVAGVGAAALTHHDNTPADGHTHHAAPPMPHGLHAHSFDGGRDGDPIVSPEIDPRQTDWHHAHHGHKPVPGTQEHPVQAPNGCMMDGTPESAGAAMLPGACATKVTWLAFDVREEHDASGALTPVSDYDDEPVRIAYADYTGRVHNGAQHPMTTTDKLVLGASAGIIGGATCVMARDITANDLSQIQRDVNRRLDAAQPPHNRRGLGMPPPQR